MVSFSQPPLFSSFLPINNNHALALAFSPHPNHFLSFKNSKISSSPSQSPDFQQNSSESQLNEEDPVKLAFSKARAYKDSSKSINPSANIVQKPLYDADPDSDDKEIPLAVKIAFEKVKEYKKGNNPEGVVSKNFQNSGAEMGEKKDELKPDGGEKDVPLALKLAMEKAKEYKKNKGEGAGSAGADGTIGKSASGLQGGNGKSAADKQSIKNTDKKEGLSISSIDFMGLEFADKKSGRGLPAGLIPQSDPFPEGDLPEVEILVGDTSKFSDVAASEAITIKEDEPEVYKPKVSTWGVFPRPSNISRTYGGGRNIRPGEALESTEERAAKDARTRQLLAAYKKKTSLNIDPKLKSECEKALKDGDALMDSGKLKAALPFYEKVMESVAFQSELHGLAALQWSICQDSLSRANEAHSMYEKLKSHPIPRVSKMARQFDFGFQAMEMMKVSSVRDSGVSSSYQNYFEAFVQDKTILPLKEAEVDEGGGLYQALPYVLFLLSPIVIVFSIAVHNNF